MNRFSPKGRTVLGCVAAMFWNVSLRALLFSLIPVIARDLDLSSFKAAVFVIAANLGYVVAVWFSGRLGGPPRRVIVTGALVALGSLFATAFLKSYVPLLVAIIVMCFGTGLYMPKGLFLLSEATPVSERGKYLSFHELGAMGAFVVGSLVAGFALSQIGWTHVLLAWGGSTTLLTLALMALVPEPARYPTPSAGGRRSAGDGAFWGFIFIGGAIFSILGGLFSILPVILVDKAGLDPKSAAYYVGVVRIAGMLGPVIAGPVSDLLVRSSVMAGLLGLSAASLGVVAFSGYGATFWISVTITLIAISGAPTVFFASVTEYYRRQAQDGVVGTVASLSNGTGMVVAPLVLAALLERSTPAMVFGAVALVAGLGGALSLLASRVSEIHPREAETRVSTRA